MEPILKFEISRDELFCLAAHCGYNHLINIPYEENESREELDEKFKTISSGFREKKWLSEDFDGNIEVDTLLAAAMLLVAQADILWTVQINTNIRGHKDMAANIYKKGSRIFLLEAMTPEKYRAELYDDNNFYTPYILSKYKFPLVKEDAPSLETDDVVRIAKKKPYFLVNLSRYSFGKDSIVCEDSSICAAFEEEGAYIMAADESGGCFVPADESDFYKENERMFAVEVKENE